MDANRKSARPLGEILGAVASAGEKTPSTVLKAFVPDALSADGRDLPEINSEKWLLLEKIKSPFTRRTQGSDVSFLDVIAALYVMVTPAGEVRQALRGGSERFEEIVGIFAKRIRLSELPLITEAIANHIANEFAPGAEMVRAGEAGEGGEPPLPRAAPSATAPAAS